MKIGSKSARSEIAIVGAACRFPGVHSLEQFWDVLSKGRNTVSPAPKDRWSIERFLRPGEPEPGFAYTFAGGYLDDPLAFDPSPFGISPREAQQMDPQQRLLLEVVWQALEDAAIPPSALAGQRVGVYIGASMVDYQSGASNDPAVMESHFMTGNSLSILSNRISYIFDFQGPSFTVDSACSSSFVALAQALDALRSGEIDHAVVGGVNLLLSPAPFIGFSQARMLSPTGLSRPFSQEADGYVRSEGAVALILRRKDDADTDGNRTRGIVVGAAVNSDGRTSGISLPSLEGQQRLIEQLYAETGVEADDLAFVEAHGTGTRVGDPIEANAIGQSLGLRRSTPLPIGSVKSNIGHLEAASGLAGLLKSMLALEKGSLPRSLFLDQVNDAIDFTGLSLSPNAQARPLDLRKSRHAGICNYGFGGTNAHVILRAADRRGTVIALGGEARGRSPRLLLLSGADRNALVGNAEQLAGLFEAGLAAPLAATAIGHGREALKHRVAVPLCEGRSASVSLREFIAERSENAGFAAGVALATVSPVVFVFSGNGSQFAEMGRAAYAANARFRAEIDTIDGFFQPLSGWSIGQRLQDSVAAEALEKTSVSQPLIYAIQSALAGCLQEAGIQPEAVLGHSVGEIAAAEASGALSREQAVLLVYLRSKHQEGVRGLGSMLVVAAEAERVRQLLAGFGDDEIEIAAINSATSTSVSGRAERLKAFARHCRAARVATIALDIDYPFHSSALDPLKTAMMADLAQIRPSPSRIPFISTVTGEIAAGESLDAEYWWRNIRLLVQFQGAVLRAGAGGGRIFIEIGPRPILTGAIAENLRDEGLIGVTLASFSQKDGVDPVEMTIARLVVHGAGFDRDAVFGPRPDVFPDLPGYAFQRRDYNLPNTAEAYNAYGRMLQAVARHPLLGARMADGSPEWRSLVDPVLVPYLDDHRVDGGVIVPAAGLIEIALAAGRDLFGTRPLELDEFDVVKALAIAADETREISTRFSEAASTLEIWSRRRFSAQEWVLHAHGRIGIAPAKPGASLLPPIEAEKIRDTAHAVYAEALRAGLEYGPCFRLVASSERDHVTSDLNLAAPVDGLGAFQDLHVLHPASLDATFHGLFIMRPQKDGEKKAHLPVRFRKIRVFRHGATIRRAITLLTHETERFKTIAITLFDDNGEIAASVEAAVLRALYLSKATIADRTFHEEWLPLLSGTPAPALEQLLPIADSEASEVPPAWLVTRAFAVSLAHRLLSGLAEDAALVPPSTQGLAEAARTVVDGFGLLDASGLRECPLPAPEALLATLVNTFPEANFEIRLAAHGLAHSEKLARSGEKLPAPAWLREQLEAGGMIARPAFTALRQAVVAGAAQAGRKWRVLAAGPWSAGLMNALTPMVEAGEIELTLAAPNIKAIDTARAHGSFSVGIEFLDLSAARNFHSPLAFDCLVASATAPLGAKPHGLPAELRQLLRAGAPALVAQPGADAALDFLCAPFSGWLDRDKTDSGGLWRIPSLAETRAALERFGIVDIAVTPTSDGLGALLAGTVPAMPMPANQPDRVIGLSGADGPLGEAISRIADETVDPDDAPAIAAILARTEHPIFLHALLAEDENDPIGLESKGGLAGEIGRLKSVLEALAEHPFPVRLIVLTQGAGPEVREPSPLAAGMRGFLRVAINEFPGVDLRMVDFTPDLTEEARNARLGEVITLDGDELELTADSDGLAALRMRRGLFPVEALQEHERAMLRFEQAGRLDSFTWITQARRAPEPEEIEIEVAAIGLNFRDILVGLGILDDDLLGAGLTAAALGFECSGIVRRVGEGVTRLQPGDAVMGFATNTFASHLTSPDWHFFKVPEGVSLEAAATIPVAFATAWFGLVKRAQITASDDVLIHGAAGGVGLAAIQFAKLAGARVLATASSEERRAIARAAGADLTYDSRQERFVEAIHAETGGVDVVLNSLAGAAMTASFKLVKPFGRFVELGKRDYLDNTQLALRPFVRNLTYFGIDLDELLAHERGLVQSMMQTISDQFARGELKPLPYRVFEAHEISAAFRLMQASDHVGKIVIRPARQAVRDGTAIRFAARDGVYLVVGGTSGLGFATGRWLAEKGAGTVVLASRRGKIEDGFEAEIAALRAAGTRVVIEALDVTDEAAVHALVGKLEAQYGPIRGVVHTAVLLDDGMIAKLTPERLLDVLKPKLLGAAHLDSALGDRALDFFVLYSSATTVIGSPGQGAYVAANAWLEGFARQRRSQGKPALAIGWGAISDVGIIARDKQLGRRLRRTTGVVGISSSESLAHLGRLLALGDAASPMQFYTNIAPGAAAEKLRLLQSPAFEGLGLIRREEAGEEGGDLVSAIEGKSEAEASGIVVQALRREISHILRMPEDQIDISRPLGELGLDSLMALELQLGIERLCGTDVPMVGAGDRRIGDIAATILKSLRSHADPAETILDEPATENLVIALSNLHGSESLSEDEARELRSRLKASAGGRAL